jgi:hypothetical protein
MKFVAESFSWPFRGDWKSSWLPGLFAVILIPIAFIPLLGYAIAATRAAETNPTGGPPSWKPTPRLLTDGFWTALVIALLTTPFALALNPLASFLATKDIGHVADQAQSQLYAHVIAAFILALPWGLLLLLLMPHATARFAHTGNPTHLIDFQTAVRGVKNDFATWNLAAAAIVTAWALGLAAVGLLCIGLVPGVFYAILVSAHATAALHDQGANSPPR